MSNIERSIFQWSPVDKLNALQRASLAELDALFASLQHRGFRGEL
jgi:type I restriction enzyme, S subunit